MLALCLVLLPARGAAQPDPQVAQQIVTVGAETGGISANRRALELTGSYLVEAWDLNGTPRDRVAGGSVGVSLPIHESWGGAIELLGAHVVRQIPPDAAVVGFLAMVRKRLTDGQRWSLVVEGGLGGSYASVEVPDRGTRFNYLLEAGAGLTRPVASRTSLLIKVRLLHVSNNSLKGPDHNPDIQALGAQAGVAIRF